MKTSAKVLLTLLIVISLGKGLISLISAWRGKDDAILVETRLHKNKLTIISKTDNIEIQNIQFNRGNCSYTYTSKDLEKFKKDLEDLEEGCLNRSRSLIVIKSPSLTMKKRSKSIKMKSLIFKNTTKM